MHQVGVKLAKTFGHRAKFARPNHTAINGTNRRLRPKSAGQKRLVRAISVDQTKVALKNGDLVCAAQVDYLLASDSIHAVIAGTGPHRTLAHDKEVTGVRCVHETMHVKHQRLVSARFGGGDAGEDAV